VRVADDHQRLPRRRERGDDLALQRGRVLELVDEHVLVPPRDGGAVGGGAEERQRVEEEIVVVEASRRAERRRIGGDDPSRRRAAAAAAVHAARTLLSEDTRECGRRVGLATGGGAFRGQLPIPFIPRRRGGAVAQQLADDSQLLSLSGDAEARRDADGGAVRAEQRRAEGVKGLDGGQRRRRRRPAAAAAAAAAITARGSLEALGHLGRRLLREGEREHRLRVRALLLQQVEDARDDDARLARPRARLHRHQPVAALHHLALLVVEAGEERGRGGGGRRCGRRRPRRCGCCGRLRK